MSCCGMPRKSDEPEYTMHGLLVNMLAGWETNCPGIQQAVHEEIATGDWDKQDGAFVPPYSLEDTFQVAQDTLAKRLVALETARLHRQGPWLVRMGLSKPAQTLTAKDREVVDKAIKQSAEVLAAAQAEQVRVNQACVRPSVPTWNMPQWNGGAPVKVSFTRG